MALDMKIHRKISKAQGTLVELAENLVKDSNGIWEEKKGLKESQLRNVAGVASSEDCLAVVTNFIKYQIGRTNKDGEGWKLQTEKKPYSKDIPADKFFGEAVIHLIQQNILKKMAGEIGGPDVSEETREEIGMSLFRSFWGYLIHYNKYRNKGGQDDVRYI